MKAMHSCSDGDAFDWIRNGREVLLASNDPIWKGNFVSNLIPNRFDAYVKILHSIEANYTNIDRPLSDGEIDILKIPSCKKLRSFVENSRKEGKGSKIKWRALAQLLDVPFETQICHAWFRTNTEPGCWPRFLYGPNEGALNEEELSAVLSVLRNFTTSQECFFRFAEIPFVGTDKPILFRGVLEGLPGFLSAGEFQFSPEYWWPADLSWCLCSEYDLEFTIGGGSKALISAVLKDVALEALEVTPRTRIDNYAPMLK
jgi:hypothetical protein